MRTEIIEILQKRYPEYCMQHIDTANEILRLFSVVRQSEQCNHVFQEVYRGVEYLGNQCECGEWQDLT